MGVAPEEEGTAGVRAGVRVCHVCMCELGWCFTAGVLACITHTRVRCSGCGVRRRTGTAGLQVCVCVFVCACVRHTCVFQWVWRPKKNRHCAQVEATVILLCVVTPPLLCGVVLCSQKISDLIRIPEASWKTAGEGGRQGGREGRGGEGREGARERGKGREGGRELGREEGREPGSERGRQGGREGEREGGSQVGEEGVREGVREPGSEPGREGWSQGLREGPGSQEESEQGELGSQGGTEGLAN